MARLGPKQIQCSTLTALDTWSEIEVVKGQLRKFNIKYLFYQENVERRHNAIQNKSLTENKQ